MRRRSHGALIRLSPALHVPSLGWLHQPRRLTHDSLEEGAPSTTGGGEPAEPTAPPLPQGAEPANLDPADFVATIDNQYWPMAKGSRWVYKETDGEGNVQRVEVTVTPKTKTILGIQATVVHDIVTASRTRTEQGQWLILCRRTAGPIRRQPIRVDRREFLHVSNSCISH